MKMKKTYGGGGGGVLLALMMATILALEASSVGGEESCWEILAGILLNVSPKILYLETVGGISLEVSPKILETVSWNSPRSGASVSPKLGDSIAQIRDSIA